MPETMPTGFSVFCMWRVPAHGGCNEKEGGSGFVELEDDARARGRCHGLGSERDVPHG